MQSTKLIFFGACLGMLLFGIGLITLGSVASGLQAKFGLDAISSGTLFSILPVGILAGSLVFGPFSDRYGYKIFLLISCINLFIGFQGIAYASSLTLLKWCIFLFGFGGGAINGATNAVVSDISTQNKGANLSLLGVFFAIGALGMPVVLGVLEKQFTFQQIVSSVGYLALVAALVFLGIKFPPAKQLEGRAFRGFKLLSDNLLLVIGFFLLCQSSFEGIINNWTTLYLSKQLAISKSNALYALSMYVVGMAVMRLLIGSVFRNLASSKILAMSFVLLLVGCSLLHFAVSPVMAIAGLVILGAGLAAGFPIMLGFVGNRYAEVSGTAFSMVLTIALLGNMAVNYLMGIVADRYGIQHLTTISFSLLGIMFLLSFYILRRTKY